MIVCIIWWSGFFNCFFLVCLFFIYNLVLNNISLVISLVILFIVSFYDDLRQLSSKVRFFVHFIVEIFSFQI